MSMKSIIMKNVVVLDLASKYGAKEIAVFHTTDTWGTGGAIALQNAATDMNINIARVFSFPRDTSQTIIDDHIKALSETNLKNIFLYHQDQKHQELNQLLNEVKHHHQNEQ